MATITQSTENAIERPRELEAVTQAALEQRLVRRVLVCTLIAIPLFVGLWIGLMALVVSFTSFGYTGALLMGAAVGVLFGIFWGAWAGFTLMSTELDRANSDN